MSASPRVALEGLQVPGLTRLLPGATSTLLLADLGADMVKVEQPGALRGLGYSNEAIAALQAAGVTPCAKEPA